MDAVLPIVLQLLAGTAVAWALGRLVPALSFGLAGAPSLGGLGGVIVGELKDHITGAHHHMNGQDMAGMSMAPATDPTVMLLNLLWGGAGGGLFLILACLVCKLVPPEGGR